MWAEGQGQTKQKFYILSTHCTAMQNGQALEHVSKKACLQNPNQIPELIMDGKSDESLCDVVATEYEEFREKVLLEPHLQSQSKYKACSSAQAPLNPDSASTFEKEDDQIWTDPQKKQPPKLQYTLPLHSAECSTYTYLQQADRGKNDSKASHINGSFMPLKEFSYCISYCLLWRLIDIITGAWTV